MGQADEQGEILDEVDDGNRVIGRMTRAEAHKDPRRRHRAVHVFVRNAKGHLFLQKRSSAKLIQPGKWDTSVGGHLAAGQGYEEAAVREAAEELGIGPEHSFLLQFSHEYIWKSEAETEHVKTYVLEYEGPFHLSPSEVEDGRFFSMDEIRQVAGTGMLTPNLEEELMHMGVTSRS